MSRILKIEFTFLSNCVHSFIEFLACSPIEMKYSKAKILLKVSMKVSLNYEKANNFILHNISGFLSQFSAGNCLTELDN